MRSSPRPIPAKHLTSSSKPHLRARPRPFCAPTRRCSTSGPSWSGAAGPSTTGKRSPMANHKKRFTVGWLYPDLMNIYGDRGNILTLLKRAERRDYDALLIELERGTANGTDEVDVC